MKIFKKELNMPCGEDYNISSEEKCNIVSGRFLYSLTNFAIFKKYESYWLEYIGNDIYIGRSDNILNKMVTITPYQLCNYFSETKPTDYEKCMAKWFYNIRTWGLTTDEETNENFCDSQAHAAVKYLHMYLSTGQDESKARKGNCWKYFKNAINWLKTKIVK